MTTRRLALICIAAVLSLTPLPAHGQLVQEYVGGLMSPRRTLALPDGSLLVVEAGLATTNSGRISMIDRDRRRFTVIDQLPSAFHGADREPAGPSAVLLFGRQMYILVGSGDVSLASAGGIERVNPAPSSPLFSSILLLELPSGGTDLPTGFRLPRAAHDALASGRGAYLTNADGQSARISRLLDFTDFVPMPRPDAPDNVQISNTFAMVGSEARFHITDSARNLVWTAGPSELTPRVVATFPPVSNTVPGVGPPVVDAVPTSIRAWGDHLLVSFLSGFPFGPGATRVALLNRNTGDSSTLIAGLQTVLDVLPVTRGRGQFYVLEYSTNFLAGAPGRLLLVDDPGRTPLVIADGLLRPTSLSQDARTGDLYITETGTGRIVRVPAPQ